MEALSICRRCFYGLRSGCIRHHRKDYTSVLLRPRRVEGYTVCVAIMPRRSRYVRACGKTHHGIGRCPPKPNRQRSRSVLDLSSSQVSYGDCRECHDERDYKYHKYDSQRFHNSLSCRRSESKHCPRSYGMFMPTLLANYTLLIIPSL